MSYLSRTVTVANGVATAFPVSFSYQSRSDVDIFVHAGDATHPGVAKVEGVDFDWTSDGIITFRAGKVPTNGQYVDVRRSSILTAMDNIVQPGTLSSAKLNENDQQLLFLTQELSDRGDEHEGLIDGILATAGFPMIVSLFAAASLLSVPVGSNAIRTTGHGVPGKGAAEYIYDAAVDAAYVVANPKTAFRTANGRGFRLNPWQPLSLLMFGAVADDPGTGAFGTDDYPAYTAAANFIQANTHTAYAAPTLYRGGPTLSMPSGGYYFSGSVAPLYTGKLIGDGGKGWGSATRIRFPAGVDGLQLQAHNTNGKTGYDAVAHFAGDRFYVSDIAFIGAYASTGIETDTHGIRGKRAATIERCTFDGFEGDGLYCHTTFGSGVGATEGNTNVMRVIDCEFTNNRNGRSTLGADANAITFLSCSYTGNRAAGVDEEGFLGDHEFGPHFDGNARTADNVGTAAKPASYSFSGGHVYFCIFGQEAWCAANAPSGSTADNTGWGYAWDQGIATPATGVPAYAGGMTWRAGGPVIQQGANNSSTIMGAHIETNGISQIDQGMLMQGTLYQVVRVTGATLFRNRANTISGTVNGVQFGGTINVLGDLKATGGFAEVNNASGGVIFNLRAAAGQTPVLFGYSDATSYGEIWLSYPGINGMLTRATANFRWDIGAAVGTQVAGLDATGLNLAAGLVYKVGGTKVIGAQGGAVADPSAITSSAATVAVAAPTKAEFDALVGKFNQLLTDFTSVRTQQVALLARLRAATGHGLIA